MQNKNEIDVQVNGEKETKVKVGATIKSWIAIGVAALSIGFSVGLWASQGSSTVKSVAVIEEKLSKMPLPENVANKEVVDVQFKMLSTQLETIRAEVCKMSDILQKHQEMTMKQEMRQESKK